MSKRKIVYKYKNFIEVEKYFLKKKKIKDFHKIKLADGCMAIIIKKNKILILKEFRAAFNSYTYGLPGGMIDKNETPKNCLKREIKEELGIKLKKIKKIFGYKRNGNYGCGKDHIFLCNPETFSIKLEKEIYCEWKNPAEIISMIKKKKFKTPGVVTALLYFLVVNKNLKLKVL